MISVFLKELDEEAVTTRKMLGRIPNDKYDWKPHEKSMTIRRLSAHIAELPAWVALTINTSELDFAKNPYQEQVINNTAELLVYFEKSLAEGRAALEKGNENQLEETWTLRNGEQVYLATTKSQMIRTSISQIIHHRAQLGVFLRLLNIPIPGSYGPSADEPQF
ncbi:MAG: DinB family protein [Flavitalea sp.]